MRAKLEAIRKIAALRRRGLSIGWNVTYTETAESTVRFGERCDVAPGTILLVADGELVLGDDVIISSYANVRAAYSHIRMGSRCLIGQFSSVVAINHAIGPEGVVDAHGVDRSRHGVVLGDDCWVGAGAAILPGVTLGDRCIVGAGAIVTKSYPADTVLVGPAARPLGS